MATHSSILAWKILWTEEQGGLQSIGLQRVYCEERTHDGISALNGRGRETRGSSVCHMRIHLSQEASSQQNLNMLYLDPRL